MEMGSLLLDVYHSQAWQTNWNGRMGGLRTPQDSMERSLDKSRCFGVASHKLKRLRTIVLTKLEKLNNSYYFQNGVIYNEAKTRAL